MIVSALHPVLRKRITRLILSTGTSDQRVHKGIAVGLNLCGHLRVGIARSHRWTIL